MTLVKVGAFFFVLLVIVAGIKGYRDLATINAEKQNLEAQITASESRIRVLKDRIVRIKDDPATLEQLAREELGWVRPGDVVIVLPEEPAPR
jgi:cell division protein FtsB